MNAHTYIGVGFPCLHGYRCLAIPSDKQSRLGSHLLFVVWLQKEIMAQSENLGYLVKISTFAS